MKILQIFGAVVAVHLLAFIFIFASPGCSSSPRNVPTPDATLPSASNAAAQSYNVTAPVASQPSDLGTGSISYTPTLAPGRATPTRPGSPNAAAITPSAPAAESVTTVSTYTVQKGDSLWSIAKKNHLTIAELTKANNLTANSTLTPGKKLIIPGKTTAAAPKDLGTASTAATPTPVSAAPAAPADALKHTVVPGDTLSGIAKKYQVSKADLVTANGIPDPTKPLKIGQQLVIPGMKAVKGASHASTPRPSSSKPASTKPAATAPAATEAPTATETPTVSTAPRFEIKPPPPGQDLDAGLKDSTTVEVPTIKVEDPKPEEKK